VQRTIDPTQRMIKKLLRISLRYGTVGGILAFVLLLVMYYLGRHPLVTAPFLDFRILLFGIFIFFALKEFRDYEQDGVLYFAQAMIGGLAVILIMTTITSILVQIFGTVEENFVTTYIDQVTAYVRSFSKEEIERVGKEAYDRNLSALPSTNISKLTITYFVHGMVIGFFVNIILSVILRRQPKT
jgi:putative flippase GtrA